MAADRLPAAQISAGAVVLIQPDTKEPRAILVIEF